jgi:hypothetical protein
MRRKRTLNSSTFNLEPEAPQVRLGGESEVMSRGFAKTNLLPLIMKHSKCHCAEACAAGHGLTSSGIQPERRHPNDDAIVCMYVVRLKAIDTSTETDLHGPGQACAF